MNTLHRFIFAFILTVVAQPGWGCGFCSAKKTPLASGNLSQEPGQANRAINSLPTMIVTNSQETRPVNSFSYDLRNYRPTGQRSEDPNWTSEIKQ